MKTLPVICLYLLVTLVQTFAQETSTLIDSRDRTTYQTVKIGNQWWMAENLKYLSGFCYGDKAFSHNVNNSINYCESYGKLYRWNAAMDACPSGWHLPSLFEWDELFKNLGGVEFAGNKMKKIDNSLWQNLHTLAKNISGFNGLPGGYCDDQAYWYLGAGVIGYWWSSDNDYYQATAITLKGNLPNVGLEKMNKGKGVSVRCIKN